MGIREEGRRVDGGRRVGKGRRVKMGKDGVEWGRRVKMGEVRCGEGEEYEDG